MIEKSYSREGQDIFVDLLLEKGFFLDIGCGGPVTFSNTYALELAGWTGVLLDSSASLIEECKRLRKSPVFLQDCTSLDWARFLEENHVPKVIDYISLDVDDGNIAVIQNFPFDIYEFKIMTFETDCYWSNRRKEAELRIMPQQYRMMLEDGVFTKDGKEYVWEDWWVNTNYIKNNFHRKNTDWTVFLRELKEVI